MPKLNKVVDYHNVIDTSVDFSRLLMYLGQRILTLVFPLGPFYCYCFFKISLKGRRTDLVYNFIVFYYSIVGV